MQPDIVTFEAQLEVVAAALLDAKTTDADLSRQIHGLELKLEPRHGAAVRAFVLRCGELVSDIARATVASRPPRLAALGAVVRQLQGLLGLPPELLCVQDPSPSNVNAGRLRDAETIELFNDFLVEAADAIATADEILMAIEHEGVTGEHVNALFRVFHTLKGMAGILDFQDIISLAHATETLIQRAREGRISLDGPRLERVFEATTMMQKLLSCVRSALELGGEPEDVDLRALLAAIEAELGEPVQLQASVSAGRDPDAVENAVNTPVSGIVAATPAALAVAPAVSALRLSARGVEALASEAERRVEASDSAPAALRRAPTEGAAPVAVAAKIRETLKVDVDRVEKFVEMVGELIIVQSMVVHAPEITALQSLRLQGSLSQLSKISRDLQDVAMRMRMVPVRGLFKKLARMVRELARKVGKDVILSTSGEGAEMDRSMVEKLEEPLVHMIRNSIDHGVEDPEARKASGKSPTATIRLSAYHAGGSVVVEILDDGKGLNREAIVKKAKQNGLIREGEILPDADVYNMIFAPGFSTAAKITEISGRGVGMDVVKRNIEAMRGRVQIASTSGQGTLFKIVLPLTMAIIDGMLIACGSEVYILPSLLIVESFQPTRAMLFSLSERGELVSVRGELLPLIRLSRVFRIDGAQDDPTQALVVVVESLGRKVALVVDDVIDEQQVVIKSLDAGIGGADYFTGAAILSDGRVGLILNVDRIGSMAGPDNQAPARKRLAVEAAS